MKVDYKKKIVTITVDRDEALLIINGLSLLKDNKLYSKTWRKDAKKIMNNIFKAIYKTERKDGKNEN